MYSINLDGFTLLRILLKEMFFVDQTALPLAVFYVFSVSNMCVTIDFKLIWSLGRGTISRTG